MIFHFRAFAKDTTTVLGTLTEAEDKRFRVHYNGPGEGSFSINRHSSQAGWVAAGNYIRVHIGNIFTDPVFGFFIGQGDDTTVSQDEEGGEILTRAGPGALSYLSRAIIDPTGSNARYKDGVWRWTDGTMGQIMADLIDDAQARGALPRLTYDFDATNDSNGDPWDVFDGDFDLNVGLKLDEAMARLQSAGFIARMSPGFVLSAYKTVGTDLSGSITFEKGVNITADGQREIFASPAVSSMLVQGTTKLGALKFVWATDAGVETALGERIEGFTSYQSTASDTVLGRVGTQAINRLKKRRDGLSQLGVLETTFVPFVHYQPGDTVNVNIPGEFDNLHAPATAIALVEDETGQAMAALEFEDIAFEPLQLNDKTDPAQSPSSGGTGGGGASPGGGCDGCPPFTPGGDILVADPSVEALTLHFWEAAVPGSFMTETTDGTPVTTAYGGFGFGVSPALAADNTKQSTAGCEYLDTRFERRMAMSYNADAGGGLIYDMATVHLVLVGIEEGPGDPQTARVKLMRGNWPVGGPPNETGLGLATVEVPLTADSVFSDPGATVVTYDFQFGFSGSLAQMIIAIDNGSGEQPGWVIDSYAPDICNATALHHAQVSSNPPIDQAYQVQIDTTNSTITMAKALPGTTTVTPVTGQTVTPSSVTPAPDGTTKVFTTQFPYMPGSLTVYVDGVQIVNGLTETEPASGTFSLDFAPLGPAQDPPNGETVTTTYRAADTPSVPVSGTSLRLATVNSDPMPSYLGTISDSTWGTTIRRITNTSGERHTYAKVQAWNSDGSKIFVRPGAILDGTTYARTSHSIPAEARWSNTNPDIMYGVVSGGAGFVRHTVSTGSTMTLRTWSGFTQLRMGTNEGNISDNDRYVVLNENDHFVIYDITNNTYTEHNLGQGSGKLDNIAISHSGNYIVAVWIASGSGRYHGMELFTNSGTFIRQLTTLGGSHGDFAYDTAGHEVWITCSSTTGVRAFRLDTASSTLLLNSPNAYSHGHVSGRMTDRPGWVGLSDYGGSRNPGYGQLAAVKVDGSGEVEIFGFTHHYDDNGASYAAQPQACWNRDGTKVIFASNWGVSGGPVYDFEAQG